MNMDSIKQIFTGPFLAAAFERVLEKDSTPEDRAEESHQFCLMEKHLKCDTATS